MRGADDQPGAMCRFVSLQARVPPDHPLRTIRGITDRALERDSFRSGTPYRNFGRPSIPPEEVLRALLVQVLWTIRSERQLIEQMDGNLLFRWFGWLGIDDPVWGPKTFAKNRGRLLDGDPAAAGRLRDVGPCPERVQAGHHLVAVTPRVGDDVEVARRVQPDCGFELFRGHRQRRLNRPGVARVRSIPSCALRERNSVGICMSTRGVDMCWTYRSRLREWEGVWASSKIDGSTA
jgi:transposase